MIDFDDIEDWAPKITTALSQHVPDSVAQELAATAPEFVEDARDLLFELTGRDTVIDATLAWIRSREIVGYHGTRLTDEEVASVRANGLVPLKAEARRPRLERALSLHPRWHEVSDQLDAAIQAHGRGGVAGNREGQVHLTLSKAGLTKGFNHYLTHGAEFDQNVASKLLGQEGKELLASDGKPTMIKVAVPGPRALDAAHPYFGIEDLRDRGGVPNLVDHFLEAWSFRLAHPGFQSHTLRIDCGMIFRSTVPAAWIIGFEGLAE